MAKFILHGDLIKPGSVTVEADSLDEAIEKARHMQCEVTQDHGRYVEFHWSGYEEDFEVIKDAV